jgi:hypothetical protein
LPPRRVRVLTRFITGTLPLPNVGWYGAIASSVNEASQLPMSAGARPGLSLARWPTCPAASVDVCEGSRTYFGNCRQGRLANTRPIIPGLAESSNGCYTACRQGKYVERFR